MRFRMSAPLAGVSLLVAAGAANAQTQPAASSSVSTDDSGLALQEIIVTARRREESLEDVPQTVNALSSDSIEKLNFLKFDDVAAAVPGLQLSAGTFGYDVSASVRGVTFDRSSQTNPTVAVYVNDAPIETGTGLGVGCCWHCGFSALGVNRTVRRRRRPPPGCRCWPGTTARDG